MDKVYTVGYVVIHQGEEVEHKIFKDSKDAIKHVEDICLPNWPNSKFERDDSKLEKNEIACWYELRPTQQLRDNKITWNHEILRRNGDYYRVLERELV